MAKLYALSEEDLNDIGTAYYKALEDRIILSDAAKALMYEGYQDTVSVIKNFYEVNTNVK